jgi:glycosyltransferase involved in cell wall biosynthesis
MLTSSNSSPLVSVIMPCFFATETISFAVRSVANQSYRPIELIIVSDDQIDYRPLADPICNGVTCVFTSTGQVGSGPSVAKNEGLLKAQGSAVIILDADDHYDPDFIEKVLPVTMHEGACVTPRRTVTLDRREVMRANGYSAIPKFAVKERIQIEEYVRLPFGWQTAYRRDVLRFPWEKELFDQDMILECRIFEYLGYAPFRMLQGYNYAIRQGSICHSQDSPMKVINSYRRTLDRLRDPEDRLGLSDKTALILVRELHARILNIKSFLHLRNAGKLEREPQVIADIIHFGRKWWKEEIN